MGQFVEKHTCTPVDGPELVGESFLLEVVLRVDGSDRGDVIVSPSPSSVMSTSSLHAAHHRLRADT